MRTSLLERYATLLGLLVMAWWFWSTAASTAWARIAALETIEGYGFAVYEQLLYNFAHHDEFRQTIHRGYEDSWDWSGHRAGTFPLAGLIYKLHSEALTLSLFQITVMLTGVIPAAWIGRETFERSLGALIGGGVYLLSPALMALALQDYQDLVMAAPALTWSLWVMRGPLWAVPLVAVLACMPREECAPLVVACALVRPPERLREGGWKRWLANLGICLLIAGSWYLWLKFYHPVDSQSHDIPLEEAAKGMFGGVLKAMLQWPPRPYLPGLPFLNSFYAWLWAPVGLIGLLAPLRLLPGLGLVFLHMGIPPGHGVDHSWGGHAHHMGPALPFFAVATIEGLARLQRLLQRAPRGVWVSWGALGLIGLAGGQWFAGWITGFNLVSAMHLKTPEYEHPAWSLVRQLDEEAVPVVHQSIALSVSNRSVSYTLRESLTDKIGGDLSQTSHMIFHRQDGTALQLARAMPGSTLVDQAGSWMLYSWTPGARPAKRVPSGLPGFQTPPEPGRERSQIPGVPPRAVEPEADERARQFH